MSQSPVLDFSKYFNEIAIAAIHARLEGVENSQVNRLIEYLDSTDIHTIILYLARQVQRGVWTETRPCLSAPKLIKIIDSIGEKIKEEDKRKEVVRKILGYFKWFYEVLGNVDRRVLDKYSRISKENIPENLWKQLIMIAMESRGRSSE